MLAKERARDVPFLLGGWGKKKDSKGQFVATAADVQKLFA
jgi:hypothetical protein